MKRAYYLYVLMLGLIVFFPGCDKDYLDRPPKDVVDANYFFDTPEQLEVATNDFYSFFNPLSVYEEDASSDNIVPLSPNARLRGSRLVPTIRGSGGWSWSQLRKINYFLGHYQKCPDVAARAKYGGIARFFRAWFYFQKVKRFGDVPWYSQVLSATDTTTSGLFKARDSRQLVMDSIMADIDYAIANIPAEKKLYEITRYTALILKARIALYEGTFRKYHNLSGDYKPLLQAAVDASEKLFSSGYTLYTDGGPDKAYRNLFGRDNQDETETILAADYEEGIKTNNLGYLMTSATQGSWGITKDVINSYLMKDGSRFTDKSNYKTMDYNEEMQFRDPRLTQTTAGPNFIANGETKPEPVDLSRSRTGYRVIKALPSKDQWSASHFDIIMFRYAEALLIYAEAKAELGTITQVDLDKSVNKLRDRVNMPHMNLANANANPDSYLENEYPNVSGANKGIILEIRRERRLEMFNEGLRWDDLMRWKDGQKIEQPMVGIYFPSLGAFDFDNDGDADVFLYRGTATGVPSTVTSRVNVAQRQLRDPVSGAVGGDNGNLDPFPQGGSFDETKDYFYPIPLEDLKLNPNLKQNPGWKDK